MSGRWVVLTAGIGAGHDGAAAGWAERLRAEGHDVDVHDFLDVLPPCATVLMRDGYHSVLTRGAWLWTATFRLTSGVLGARLVRAVLRRYRRRLLRLLPPDTVAVLATYPLAGQMLGELRRRGELGVPALTFVTDFSVHPLWLSDGLDAHLVLHEQVADDARALGARDVRVSGPVPAAAFTRPGADPSAERRRAREVFGLPPEGRLALLVAGSWGVGDVERAAAELAATGLVTPVVACGRNHELAGRLAASGAGIPLGWVDRMPLLLRGVDLMVENAGGLSSLEAMAAGLPVLTYRPIAGHGRENAAALDRAGVSTWVHDASGLADVLPGLLAGAGRERQRAAVTGLFAADAVRVATSVVAELLPAVARRRADRVA